MVAQLCKRHKGRKILVFLVITGFHNIAAQHYYVLVSAGIIFVEIAFINCYIYSYSYL